LGAELVEVELPAADEILPTYMTINAAEALAVHRQRGLWPGRRDEYGADLRPRFEAAEAIGVADYAQAATARERIRAGFVRALELGAAQALFEATPDVQEARAEIRIAS